MTEITGVRRMRSASMIELALSSGQRVRVAERRLLAANLVPGAQLGPPALDQLLAHQRMDCAEARILRLLVRRPRSRAELVRRCQGWGLSAGETDALLERLSELGLIDDQALAQRLTEQRQASGHGRLRIRHDLRRLGIDPADAGQVPDDADPASELDRARAEIRRRFGEQTPHGPRERARAAAHLARRGFDSDTVGEALGIDGGC